MDSLPLMQIKSYEIKRRPTNRTIYLGDQVVVNWFVLMINHQKYNRNNNAKRSYPCTSPCYPVFTS